MSFYSERAIKSVRKPRRCDACNVVLAKGDAALACSGCTDGDFWSAIYHPDCREAEVALNKLHDVRWGDEWILLSDLDWEDWPWLVDDFPAVAARRKITIERFEEVRAEHERVRLAWSEIDRKQREQAAIARATLPPGTSSVTTEAKSASGFEVTMRGETQS